MKSNDATAAAAISRGTRLSKSSFTSTTGCCIRRLRMFSKTAVFFFLVSGFWSQMVYSAPTPQQNLAVAGQDDDVPLLVAEMEAGKDDDYGTTELRYAGMWEKGEPAEPPDIRARNPETSPEIHIIDDLVSSSIIQAQHVTTSMSTTTSTNNTSPDISPPGSERIDLQRRIVEEEEQPDWVFNIVIQKEKTQKSAFIAPDVNWLRDLVPKVVDVVEQPETTIKEIIFNAMGKDDVIQVDQIKDKQIFINVVKSQAESEAEVPQILARLRNLMQTGGPAVDSMFQRQNSNGEQSSQNRAVVINVVIVNVLNVNVVNVILPESKAGSAVVDEKASSRTPDSPDIEEDSYIVALRESQKDRNKVSVPAAAIDHHHHHKQKLPDVPGQSTVVGGSTTQQQFNGHYLTEVPTYEQTSTARPLMAMEKDYLRSHDIQPVQQQMLVDVTEKKQPTPADKEGKPKLPIDPNASLEFVQLPTRPYFTNYIENNKNNLSQVTPLVKPNKIKQPEKLSSMTSKATNVVRNQIRTIGFIGIPILAGLASTVNAWLPAVAALGRRRKKRSALDYEENDDDDWQSNRKVVSIDDRRRAIEDAQVLALLMGKRYMNVSKETLQDSIDNWKNRDQEANAAVPFHTTDANKLASTNRPLWFQFQRPGRPQTTDTTTTTTTIAPSTVKKLNYQEDDNTFETNTKKYYSNTSPLFYSAGSSMTDDAMEHRELIDYDDVGYAGPSTSSTSSNTFTESVEYDTGNKETTSEENLAASYPESVTPHIHILPSNSPSGNDFDIVANFVQAMMMNGNNKNNENPTYERPENREDVDAPEHREDVDNPEHREEIYLIKSPSIVNSTFPGAANRVPATADSTISLFAADPIMPNWSVNSENVTNSPVTYVSLRVPPQVPSSPAKFPIKTTTYSAQPSSSDYYDDTDLIEGSDQPSSENAGLQFYEDETGITFFVSKEVPTKLTSTMSSSAIGTQETKPTSTGRPLSQWFSDPFENGLFVGSSTANTFRPVSPPSSVSTSNTPLSTQPETRPTSLPTTRPSGMRPVFQPGTRPSLQPINFQSTNRPVSTTSNIQPDFQSVTRPVSTPSNIQPNSPSGNRPTSSSFNSQSNIEAGTRQPAPVTPSLQSNRPSAPVSPSSKPQSSRPSSLLTMASFTAPNRLTRPTVPPSVDVSSNDGSMYTKSQSTATNRPQSQDFSTLTGQSSLVSANVEQNNILASIIKGAASSPLPSANDPTTNRPTMTSTSTGDINNLFGMYSSTAAAGSSTNRPIITTTSSEEEYDPTLDNVMTQLETNRTSVVSVTKRPVGGLHFINTSTDVVIISPYDVTPSSIFSSPEMEFIETEEDEDSVEPSDAITVDAAVGNQPDSVPSVSNLANFLFASSGGSSSSGSSGSSSDSSSSGGVTSSTSAVSVDPFAMLYTFGLASAGILALTLPIWVPLVVAKKKRRTSNYGPTKKKDKKKPKIKKNQYPTNKNKKKKTYSQTKSSYGEPPPNHYKDLDDDLSYNADDYYPAGPTTQHQYHSTTVDDLYRGHADYSDTDIDQYSTLYRDLFSSNSDDVFSDPGPLNSEEVYGPSSSSDYDDQRAARRRRSTSKQLNKQSSNKRFHSK